MSGMRLRWTVVALAVGSFFAGLGALAFADGGTSAATCDPLYPDFCIPVGARDLNCENIPERNFVVLQPDPHNLDLDDDGLGCEDPAGTAYPKRNLPKVAWLPMVACDSCKFATAPAPSPTATNTSVTSAPTATPTRTPTPTPTPTQLTCSAATATITGLNKSGSPETVTIAGAGLLTGWYLISENGNQRFDFPAGYVLSGTVTIQSGPGATDNPPSVLLWSTTNLWNNSADDDAFLYDCNGSLRNSFDDGV